MFNSENFDLESFQPNSPFEGWMYAKIQTLEKTMTNHLAHHVKFEIAFFMGAASLVGTLLYIIFT